MVETGGLIHGCFRQDSLIIENLQFIPNQTTRKNKYQLPFSCMNQINPGSSILGFFHTHRLSPWPGLRDYLQMHQLCKQLDQDLVLGIYLKKYRFWLFCKDNFWLKRIKQVNLQKSLT
ncbi:MAG TPA: hypothetical protein ENN77_00660 [Candidatus Wirthbacteria bacterium]|nr:hypothetical protein [Candidatus Wirthbacteria bacterium]